MFFGSLEGGTQTLAFQAGDDAVTIDPTPQSPALAWLLESGFRGEQWAIRLSAMHRKSKTVKRSAIDWP